MIPLALLAGSDIAAMFGALLVFAGVALTAVFAFKSNTNSQAVVLVADLRHDVDQLKAELAEVRGQLSMSQRAIIAAVRFIDRLVDWGRGGGKDRMPTPPKDLHEYLDPDMWGTDEHPPSTTPGGLIDAS